MSNEPFVSGFPNEAAARRAGQRFFQLANGVLGREGRDFHLVQNEHGRWHFEGGRRGDSEEWNQMIDSMARISAAVTGQSSSSD